MKFKIKYKDIKYINYVSISISSIEIEALTKTYAVEQFILEHPLCIIMDIKEIK